MMISGSPGVSDVRAAGGLPRMVTGQVKAWLWRGGPGTVGIPLSPELRS